MKVTQSQAEGARYALAGGEDDDQILCTFNGLNDFFTDIEDDQGWREATLADCEWHDRQRNLVVDQHKAKAEFGNIDLYILDTKGRVIGGYPLAFAEIIPGRPSIILRALAMDPPHPLAGRIWEVWRSGMPERKNQWTGFSARERAAWLEVVRIHNSWERPRKADKPSGASYELDGRFITDTAAFYCALGEAINGPGGYFGASLGALADCLLGGFGADVPFTLNWRHAEVAREAISADFFGTVLEILRERGVTTVLA